MTIQQMYDFLGLKREDFGEKYRIPLEVLRDWEREASSMPEYVLLLLERAIREDKAIILKDSSLELLYKHLDHPLSQAKWDMEFDYLKEVTGKDGERYWVYKDEVVSAGIRMEDGQILTDLDQIHAVTDQKGEMDFEQLELESILRSQSFL